jgi:hypothetical protein
MRVRGQANRLRQAAAVGLSVLAVIAPSVSFAAVSHAESTIITRQVTPDTGAANPPTPDLQSSTSPPTASTSYSQSPESFALTISPTRLIFGPADIGTEKKILVVNRGQASAAITTQKRNFTAGTDGSLNYQDDAPFGADKWLALDVEDFELAPGATQVVTVTVSAPVGAEPGDHQVAIVFLVPAGQTDSNIKINRGIALPLYIAAPGPVVDSAELLNLSAPDFATDGPVTINATVRNTGTVHKDFRGDSPLRVDAAGTPSPFPDFTVPRDSTRYISTTWDPPLLCICNPSVEFTNADGQAQKKSVQVIVFPLKLLGIALVAILIVILAVVLSRRHYRASIRKAAAALHRPVSRSDA